MKYIVEKYNKNTLFVISRNLKIARREMARDFPLYKFFKTLQHANSWSGDLGKYAFKKRDK